MADIDDMIKENMGAVQEAPIKNEALTPAEYFGAIKERKNHVTDEDLGKVYDNCLELLNKYKITGQVKGMHKLLFHLECIEKEREIVKAGIDTFVYRDDIEYYIDNVADDVVKIIDIESYEREIPDEIVHIIANYGSMFDQLYIVFTDYTGEVERKVEQERRAKDPILFGVFQDNKSRSVIDRFYYLGDWVDEYCDLTLDKMVNESQTAGRRNIAHSIKTPADIEELKAQLGQLHVNEKSHYVVTNTEQPKKSFFDKVKTFLKR
jgi:hypothetical protein